MFAFFERLVDPYRLDDGATPPRGLLPFVLHYTRPVMPWLAIMSLMTAMFSVLELIFFSFTGKLVDWVSASDRASFFSDHGSQLAGMAALVVVVFPLLAFFQSLLIHQTIFGNYPMIVRWRAHRYILGQSLSFFQDEFAGRVSQKVMQTFARRARDGDEDRWMSASM